MNEIIVKSRTTPFHNTKVFYVLLLINHKVLSIFLFPEKNKSERDSFFYYYYWVVSGWFLTVPTTRNNSLFIFFVSIEMGQPNLGIHLTSTYIFILIHHRKVNISYKQFSTHYFHIASKFKSTSLKIISFSFSNSKEELQLNIQSFH